MFAFVDLRCGDFIPRFCSRCRILRKRCRPRSCHRRCSHRCTRHSSSRHHSSSRLLQALTERSGSVRPYPLRRGDEFFGVLCFINNNLHDVDVGFAVALLVFAATFIVGVDEDSVLFVVIIEIVDNVKLEIVAVVIGEYYKSLSSFMVISPLGLI